MKKERYLTTREFSDHFNVCQGTVRNWIAAAAIRAMTTVKGLYLIPESEIQRVESEWFERTAQRIGLPLPPPLKRDCPVSEAPEKGSGPS